jgi:carbon monoxide dehydrogenase subunit G
MSESLRAVGAPDAGTKQRVARAWHNRRTFSATLQMFRVKSSFKSQIEIAAPMKDVRDFFRNLSNFSDLLVGVDSIRRESGGIVRWTIATDTPVGNVKLSLPVRETSPRVDVIEWSPATNEKQNLLRYQIKLEEEIGLTLVRVSQQVELRRNRAWDLHPGVSLMGEARLSSALERRINEAIQAFLERAKEKLEIKRPAKISR